MNSENSERAGLKQKTVHQFEELAKIILYLAFFFCAVDFQPAQSGVRPLEPSG